MGETVDSSESIVGCEFMVKLSIPVYDVDGTYTYQLNAWNEFTVLGIEHTIGKSETLYAAIRDEYERTGYIKMQHLQSERYVSRK